MRKIRDTIIGLWPVLKPYIPKRQTILIIVLAFLVGLVWGYALDPVVFYDAAPSQLGQGWQDQFVQGIAAGYAQSTASAAPTEQLDANTITLLRSVDDPLEIVNRLGLTQIAPLAEQAQAIAATAPQPSLIASIRPWLLGVVVVSIGSILVSLLYGFYINPMVVEPIRKRMRGSKGVDTVRKAELDAIRQGREMADKLAKQESTPAAASYGPPVARNVSIYTPGRSYDDSFSIEDKANDDEYLGEYGAVISETITIGEQEKVAAIEVWLFDKEDFVNTLKAVFASEYAANDPAMRSKLETKGPIITVKPGAATLLETSSLRVQARVVDVTYGSAAPANSHFDKLSIELQAWRKDSASAPAAAPAMPVAAAAPAPAYAPPPAFAPPQPSVPPAAPFAPPPATQPVTPAPSYGAGVTPLQPPPLQPLQPPPLQPLQPPPLKAPKTDDDPFGGTGDWTPVG